MAIMPRDNPRRITARKLLRFTGQQADCRMALNELARHETMVQALRRRGVDYDEISGLIKRKDRHEKV